jgi:hypothetical protein
MDALHTLAVNTIGPVVDVLESLSWIGVNTHFVKNAVVVRIEPSISSLTAGSHLAQLMHIRINTLPIWHNLWLLM